MFWHNGGDFSNRYWELEEKKFSQASEIKIDLRYITGNLSFVSRNVRWIYSTTAYLLLEEAEKQKNPNVRERLVTVGRKHILRAVEATEFIDGIAVNRGFIHHNVLDPVHLFNPNRPELKESLTRFINHPPVSKK